MLAFPYRDRFAELEVRLPLMNQRLALLSDTHIHRMLLAKCSAQTESQFDFVAGSENDHLGERTQQREIFEGMMGRAEFRV